MVNIDKIKSLARSRGIKLGKLCEMVGEDANYFNKVKMGLRRMDDERIRYLAHVLNTSFEYLTDETDNPSAISNRHPIFRYNRYNERRIARGLTPNYVEERVGLPYGYMDSFNELTDKEVYRLAIVLDTTYEYLMGITDDPSIPLNDNTGVKIKVFGEVAAGIPIKQIDNFDPEDADSWEEIDRRTAKNGTYFALKIKGDSMEPRIFDGDTVIVRYQDTIESGETAVVAINGDEATCKKVTLTSDGLVLTANNPKYTPRFFSNEAVQKLPIRILGKVVEVRGKI